jgi:hypothetical protein
VIAGRVADFISPAAIKFLDEASRVASAIIVSYGDFEYGLGYLEYAVSKSVLSQGERCPFFTISVPAYNQIVQISTNGTGLAQVDSTDGISPVRQIFTSGWFFFLTVAEAATSCAIACLAVIRLWRFRQGLGNFKPTIATVCLWLELISCFLRFLYWAFDPFGSRRLIPETIKHMPTRTASFPFTISYASFAHHSNTTPYTLNDTFLLSSSTVLLTFYWHETLSATSLSVKMNISSFRVPAYVTCALAFIVEIVFLGLFSIAEIPVPLVVTFINLGYYVLVMILMAGFYIITASRIFMALYKRYASSMSSGSTHSHSATTSGDPNHSPRLSSREKADRSRLFDVTLRLSVSAGCLVLILAMAVLTFLPYFAFWFVLTVLLNMKSLSTVLSFQPPRQIIRSTVGPSRPGVKSASASSGSLNLSQFDTGNGDASLARTSVRCEPAGSDSTFHTNTAVE